MQIFQYCTNRVFSKVFTVNTVITVISQINTGTTENSCCTEISCGTKSNLPTMITPIIVVWLKLVSLFTVALPLFNTTISSILILIDQRMLTDSNYSTCYGTLSLVQEIIVITVITVKTFEKKTQLLEKLTWSLTNLAKTVSYELIQKKEKANMIPNKICSWFECKKYLKNVGTRNPHQSICSVAFS